MEEIKEFAGNLKADLLDAQHEWKHGRMTTEKYKARIAQIREQREKVMTQWLVRHPRPQPTLQLQVQA